MKSKKHYVKSLAWLIEAAFRGFVGYVLLTEVTHNYLIVVAAGYAIITAVSIVIYHFGKAHN